MAVILCSDVLGYVLLCVILAFLNPNFRNNLTSNEFLPLKYQCDYCLGQLPLFILCLNVKYAVCLYFRNNNIRNLSYKKNKKTTVDLILQLSYSVIRSFLFKTRLLFFSTC